MAKQPKEHVKAHLRKNNVDPGVLPDDVIEALNDFSPQELRKVDRLGETLEESNLPLNVRLSAVH
jgi:hypothetical protein